MLTRLIALGLTVAAMSTVGCCGMGGRSCGGYGQYNSCNTCDTCDDECPPARRPRARAACDSYACDSCGPTCGGGACGGGSCCDPCGGYHCTYCFHPFRWVGKLFCVGTWCGPCSGGRYCGEAFSEPCGCDARTCGGGCGCGHDGGYMSGPSHQGCSSCQRHGEEMDSEDGAEYVPAGEASPSPTPAPPPNKASRRQNADQYQR